MTNFKFLSDMLNIINALLQAQAGVNSCTNHEIRILLDELFDKYEELEGLPNDDKNNRGDLELYAYIIDSLHQTGFQLWQEDKEEEEEPINEMEFIQKLHDITGVPFDEILGLEEETDVTIQGIDYPENA
jgi:hypothetical protein